MSEFLLTPLLALHLLCVNVASAGPIVLIWLDWRESRGDALAGAAGRYLGWLSIGLLVMGALLGLAIGYLHWSEEYRVVVMMLQRRIFFGAWEVLFSLLLMLVAATWWSLRGARGRGPAITRGLLNFLAGTNLLYHFPFLFVVLSDIVQGRVSTPTEPIDGAGFRALMSDGFVVARVTHVVLASFAVTGLVLMHFAHRQGSGGDATRAARWGGRLALLPTTLQVPVGLWMVVALPQPAQMALTGGDLLTSGLFVASVLLSFSLLHSLSAMAFGEIRPQTYVKSISTMVLIVVLMTAVLRRI